MNGTRVAILFVSLLTLIGSFAAPTAAVEQASDQAAPVTIPNDAVRVCQSCDVTSLDEAVRIAPEGATIAVDGGSFDGPLIIDKSLALVGIDHPVIDGNDQGTVVTITAPDVTLQGFTIRNSGSNFDKEDSAVYIDGAPNVKILDNEMENALFGVNVAQSEDLLIARNTIVGKDVEMGVRGDGIKIWYSHRTQILENHVTASRDLLVWYSNDVVVRDNVVRDGRYGFHFMNSDNGLVEHNRMVDNSVGIYLMYGKQFIIRDNLLEGSRGPSGHGLGLKEIDGVEVEGNVIHDNRIGVYIDNSPLSPDVYDHFQGNLIAYNDTGLGMLPSSRNNVFTRNSLIENLEQVTVLGGGPIGNNQWSVDGVGNFWSDYVGYDANDDGVGDVPFKSEALSEQLMSSWPILQLFRFSVADSAVEFGAKAVPMFRKEPLFTDDSPLVEPVIPTAAPMPDQNSSRNWARFWSLGLLGLAGAAVAWGSGNRRATERALRGEPAWIRARLIRPVGTGGMPPQGKAS